jgi:carboxymethylenebutenolidase
MSDIVVLPPSGSGPGILLAHAWWGLNGFFQEFAARLAESGYVVHAVDLYDGKVATTVDEAETLMREQDTAAVAGTIDAALDALIAHPARRGERVALIGFSMGAFNGVPAAMRHPEKVAAVVTFYGPFGGELAKLRAPVLGHFAGEDEFDSVEYIREFEQELKAAGVDATFHYYDGLSHWFFEADRPEYDAAAAELAWERTLAFLRERLGLRVHALQPR